MKQQIIIKEFLNEKGQKRYLINDVHGSELHRAGGAGFKAIESAEAFAKSHQWTVYSKSTETAMDTLRSNPLF